MSFGLRWASLVRPGLSLLLVLGAGWWNLQEKLSHYFHRVGTLRSPARAPSFEEVWFGVSSWDVVCVSFALWLGVEVVVLARKAEANRLGAASPGIGQG